MIVITNGYYWLGTNIYYYYFCATPEYYFVKKIPIRKELFDGMCLFSRFASVCLLTRFRVMVQIKTRALKITINFSI